MEVENIFNNSFDAQNMIQLPLNESRGVLEMDKVEKKARSKSNRNRDSVRNPTSELGNSNNFDQANQEALERSINIQRSHEFQMNLLNSMPISIA